MQVRFYKHIWKILNVLECCAHIFSDIMYMCGVKCKFEHQNEVLMTISEEAHHL